MLPLAHKTMLAPMEGVGHPMFRELVASRGGVGMVCTEFVRVSRAPLSPVALRREVIKVPGVPLSVQVMGNDADKMADAAGHVADAGADVVDINLGCPMPRVVKKGVGAAMLKDPVLLYDVLCAMRASTPCLLSAKIRAGFDDAENVVRIAETVQSAGVDFISVHPRRRCDFYEGVSDWRIIKTLVGALNIPVVGNGDCWYASDAPRMMEETGCAAVMLGRPAIRNPWIFSQIASLANGETPFDPNGDDLFAWFIDTRARYRDAYGTSKKHGAIGKLKELIRWFGRAVDDDRVLMNKALRSRDEDEMVSIIEEGLRGLSADRLDLDAQGRHRFERSGSADAAAHPPDADQSADQSAEHAA